MDKWAGKVAVVTGASSGIGAETCRQLVDRGMTVVGFARRVDRLRALQEELNKKKRDSFHFIKVDLCSKENILEAFVWVKNTLKSIDVLINNAGVWKGSDLLGDSDDWKLLFETNVLAPSICSKEAVKIMQELKIPGHIVNINSDSGHYPPMLMPDMAVYGATKFSSVLNTERLRELLALQKLPIRVTSISPGLVDTEMTAEDDPLEMPKLSTSSVVDAIVYALAAPQCVNISEIIIRPTGETNLPFIMNNMSTIGNTYDVQ